MKRIVISGLVACGLLLSSLVQAELYNVQTSEQKIIEKALPVLPDISVYNRIEILKKKAKWHKAAQVDLSRMINSVATRKFFKGGKLGLWAEKQGQFPKAVFVNNGILTLPELNKKLPSTLIKLNNKQYLLRVPIVVMHGAALFVAPGEELLLSLERGSFLVNAGELFMVDGALRGWSEKTKSPAKYSGDKEAFRPFYVGWSGSETYIYGSLLESLGSQSSKAYGFSLSTYTEQDQMYAPNELNRRIRPKGWLVNSRITDLYYGFYSYEADDVALIGNKYTDSIYYGIDPHDRSHRLIIANNEVSGTKQRHGIIGSRDVSHSYFFGNNSHDNKLAGIMLDRDCNNNVLMQNSSYNNGSDGISIYESHHNLIAANRVYSNQHHGIRFRNSLDVTMRDNVILQNARYGVYGHLSDLTTNYDPNSDHEPRDLKIDPYEMRASGYLSGGVIARNGSGALYTQGLEKMGIGKLALDQNGRRRGIMLGGDLLPYSNVIAGVWYGEANQVYFSQTAALHKNGKG